MLSDKNIIAINCHHHNNINKNGICQATDCLIRKYNIENKPNECKFYQYLIKDKNGLWYLKKFENWSKIKPALIKGKMR